jgi:nucleoid-associated protein YgaU
MPDKRTRRETPISNESEYYSPLRSKRDVKKISHFKTPVLRNPDISDRGRIATTQHVWKYGDRFYKLASQYYGDSEYWWVIPWYNGIAAEAQINTGYILFIPLNLSEALNALGA